MTRSTRSANHRLIWSGSVIVRHTTSAGASMTISRSMARPSIPVVLSYRRAYELQPKVARCGRKCNQKLQIVETVGSVIMTAAADLENLRVAAQGRTWMVVLRGRWGRAIDRFVTRWVGVSPMCVQYALAGW